MSHIYNISNIFTYILEFISNAVGRVLYHMSRIATVTLKADVSVRLAGGFH